MIHSSHSRPSKHNLHRWELGLIATSAAVIAAPYALPFIGIGDAALATKIAAICGTAKGGLAQFMEGVLGTVPGVGGMLASAGWGASITSGVIGIAGVMLGDYIHRHYDRKGHIQWGTVIKYVALTTSILIALPSILSGISMGLTFLANVVGGFDSGEWIRKALEPTIGFSGLPHTAPTGLAGLAPHLLTCGRALLPAGLTWFASRRNGDGRLELPSFTARLVAPCNPIKGQPCEVTFQVIDNETGRPLEADELETVHTRKLHTMIVDSSLSDYHHLHPTYDPKRHLFTCRFTPHLQTNYAVWNDFTVKGTNTATQTKTDICIIRGLSIPPKINHVTQVTEGQLTATISCDGPLYAGKNNTLRIDIHDVAGNPVRDLEPIMGAYAHLAAFSGDGQHFIHTHPMGTEPQTQGDRGSSPLFFHITPSTSGGIKCFLQVARGGQIISLPFGQMVAKARAASSQGAAGSQPTNSFAMGR